MSPPLPNRPNGVDEGDDIVRDADNSLGQRDRELERRDEVVVQGEEARKKRPVVAEDLAVAQEGQDVADDLGEAVQVAEHRLDEGSLRVDDLRSVVGVVSPGSHQLENVKHDGLGGGHDGGHGRHGFEETA